MAFSHNFHVSASAPAFQISSSSAESCPLKSFPSFTSRSQFFRASFDFRSGKSGRSFVADRTQGPSFSRIPAQNQYNSYYRENSSYGKGQQRTSAQYGDRGNSNQYQNNYQRQPQFEDRGFNNQSSTQSADTDNINLQKNEVVLVGRVVGVPTCYLDEFAGGDHMTFGLAVVNDQSRRANPPIPIEIIGLAASAAKSHVDRNVMVRLQGKVQSKEVEDPSGQPQRQLYVLASQCIALDDATAQRFEAATGRRGASTEIYNLATLVGRAGMDPTVRTTNTGVDVCNFNIAVSTGEVGEAPIWVRLEFWDKQAEIAGNSVTKGALIEVSGRLRASAWNDAQGRARQQLSVVSRRFDVLKPAGQGRSQGQGRAQGQGQWQAQGQSVFQRQAQYQPQAQPAVQQKYQLASPPTDYGEEEYKDANF